MSFSYTTPSLIRKFVFYSLLFSLKLSASNLGQTCPTKLSKLAENEKAWENLQSIEEQPIAFLAGTPRELALSLPRPLNPQIPVRIKDLGESELKRIRKQLGLKEAEFEVWVTYDDWGHETWAVARYRKDKDSDWNWLDESYENPKEEGGPADPTKIVLPKFLDPNTQEGWALLFDNTPDELYQRPSFGRAIWTNKDHSVVVHSWLPMIKMTDWEKKLKGKDLSVILVPPPSRLGDKPVTFQVNTSEDKVVWPKQISWKEDNHRKLLPHKQKVQIKNWVKRFKSDYLVYLQRYSGGVPIQSPLTGETIDVGKLGVGEKDNQILDVVAHLKQHYESLGFNTHPGWEVTEDFFDWRGIKQANLILKIKGSLPASTNRPIILTDHIDKAIAEDIYEKTKKRVTNPGADDNATATATLLTAVDTLTGIYKDRAPKHDIWVVHFTGEEFPGSSLGARHLIDTLLKNKVEIGGNINLDMLGHRTKGDRVFQIHPGSTPESRKLGAVALGVAKEIAPEWKVKVSEPWSKESYLTQTDSAYFEIAGYPTILINEHMNLSRRLNPNYHQSIDTHEKVDLDYALAQAKVAIETLVRMAEGK